ncbi:MAG TPA: putative nucleotidyltransferase substrate binding domain-containing protein [Planctomycetota bacterium]|nr:putative nucleotidyltransferase substrate binding domain-containing protein [Planctomycetota bacterium]
MLEESLRAAIERLGARVEDLPAVALERANALFGLGGAPSDMLAAHPEDLASLGDLSLGALPGHELATAERLGRLRRARRRHTLAVAGAELSGAIGHEEAARLLSDAADALLDAVLDAVRVPATRDVAVAVIALGKLGGRELNYSSDVDLVVIRADDASVAPTEQLVRAFVRALEELPEDGRLYRVDLRLRPEGSTGAIAPRLSTALEYYARSGRTWERQAFLKARAAAGDRALGERFLAGLEPFLWGTRLDARAIEEILGLRARIEAKAGAEAERNVKEGPGGIRDVEYSVQFLQLLHGKETRATGTLEAIVRLEAANVVRPDEARALRESYGFLRRIEHALQLTRDRELKQVPTDDEARGRLARALGLSLRDFDSKLAEARSRARRTLDTLLRKPFGEAAPHPNPPPAARGEGAPAPLAIRDLVLAGGDAREVLIARGFKDPSQAARDLESLANERSPYLAPSGRARTLMAGLAPRLLDLLARAPDPDAALRNLERATATLGAKATFYELLLENQDALELFCSLAAASDFLVETLARRPGVFDEVVDRLLTGARPSREAIIEEARVALARENGGEALRDVRAVHLLLVGIRDVSGRANAQNTGRDLAVLAEGVLEALLERARATVAARHGGAPSVGFAALALGKLGAQELSYSSDLDLLFVVEGPGHAPDGTSSEQFFEEVAREALRLGEGAASAEGPLYPIDLRLRPAGGKGSLAASLDSVRSYYRGEGAGEHAADWERLALQKLRPVAGDRAFAERAATVLRDDLYARSYPGLRRVVLEMRAKQIEAAGDDDLKRAPGGLADVEFLASALALEHGGQNPALRETNTARLLGALRDANLLSVGEHLELMTAYQFLRRVELRLRVALARAESKVSRDPAERRALALRLGYVDAGVTAEDQLARELAYSKGRVRAVFERVLNRDA